MTQWETNEQTQTVLSFDLKELKVGEDLQFPARVCGDQ